MSGFGNATTQWCLTKQSTTTLQFDDDEYRTRAMKAEAEELAVAAAYASKMIERDDPECDAAIAALEAGWARQ